MVQHGASARRPPGPAADSYGEPDTVCPEHAPSPAYSRHGRWRSAHRWRPTRSRAGRDRHRWGTGIGAATASAVVAAGGSVAICGRRPEPLAVVAEAISASDASRGPCDVREPEQVAGFLEAVAARHDRVDILVNNAGGQFAAPLEQTPLKGMRAVHRLNVDAVWDLTQRVAARWMIPNRGGFIAFLGFSPRRGIPSFVALLDGAQRLGDASPRGSRSSGRTTGSARCASPRD